VTGFATNIDIGDNWILANERNSIHDSDLAFFPAVKVNNQPIRGDLEPEVVLAAVCAGIRNPPDVCRQYVDYSKSYHDDDDGDALLVILIIFAVALVILAIMALYRCYMRRELSSQMKVQVEVAVSQYYALEEPRDRTSGSGQELPLIPAKP
jgi:hypothetical protein